MILGYLFDNILIKMGLTCSKGPGGQHLEIPKPPGSLYINIVSPDSSDNHSSCFSPWQGLPGLTGPKGQRGERVSPTCAFNLD